VPLQADVLDAKAGAAPVRGRTNVKAKRAEAAPVASSKPSAKAAKPDKPVKKLQARKPQNTSGDAELAVPLAGASDAAVSPPVSVASPIADASYSKAAQWDRTTGAVRFNWNEIEQIASQQGPNQGMAKLLVAARAEGANSRWPF
jgi:hypothetical protein